MSDITVDLGAGFGQKRSSRVDPFSRLAGIEAKKEETIIEALNPMGDITQGLNAPELISAKRTSFGGGPLLVHDEWTEEDQDWQKIVNHPEFLKRMKYAEDPQEEEAKAYVVSAMAKQYDLALPTILGNYDALKDKIFGPNVDNKSSAIQVQNAKAVGKYVYEQSFLSFKWMNGTATAEDLERIRYLDAIMPEVETQFKDIPLAFKTTFLQTWPMMKESMTAGPGEALAGAGTGLVLGAAYGASKGGTLQSISAQAAIGMVKGFGAAKTHAAFNSMAEMESGLLFKRIMELEGENGEKVDFEAAQKYAAIGGSSIAASELLEVGTLLSTFAGPGVVGAGKAGLTVAKGWMSILTGKSAEVFADAFKAFGGAVLKNTNQELAQDLIADTFVKLAVDSTGNPEAFEHLRLSRKEVAQKYLETALSSAILSAGLAIGPTTVRGIKSSVQLQNAVKSAVGDAVTAGMKEGKDVSGIMDTIRRDPRVAGMSEARVQRFVNVKTNGLELLNAINKEAEVPSLEELYINDAQKSYDDEMKNWNKVSRKPTFEEYYDGYLAAIGKDSPPSVFSMERTERMYSNLHDSMVAEGKTESQITDAIGTRMEYHERVTAPERAFDAALSSQGRAKFLKQMAGTVTELEAMLDEVKTGNEEVDSNLRDMVQKLKNETSISSYGLSEGEAIATQTEMVRDEIRGLQMEAAAVRAEITALYDEGSLAYSASLDRLQAINAEIIRKEERLKDANGLLLDSGWKESALGKEVNTVKDYNLVEDAKIESFKRKIEEIRRARSEMKRVSPKLQQESERQIRVLLEAIKNAELRKEEMNDILLDAHRRKYIEFEKNVTLEERVNRIAYLFELRQDPEYIALVEKGDYRAIMERPGFKDLSDMEKFSIIFDHGKGITEMDAQNIVGFNRSKKAVGNALRTEYERIMGRIEGYETKNIPEIRMAQIEALKELIRDNKVDDSVVKYVLGEVGEFLKKMNDKHPATRQDLQRMIPAFIEELNLGAFQSEESKSKPLSISQLNRVYRMIEFLRNVGAKEMAEKKTEAKIKSEVLSKTVLDNLEGKKDAGDIKKTTNGFVGTMAHPVALFRTLGGDSMVETFVKEKLEARNRSQKEMVRRGTMIDAALKERGMKPKDFYKDRVFMGVEYQIQDLMGIYLGMQNKYTAEAIMVGTYANGQQIPEEVWSNIDQLLLPEEKEIAMIIEKDFQETWERLSDAHEKSTGTRLGRQKVYMPMVWEYLEFDNLEEELLTGFFFGSDRKFLGVYNKNLKERGENQLKKKAGIKLGLFDLWTDMVHKQEHYISSVENVEVMSRVIKDPEVARKITEVYGPAVTGQAKRYIEHYASPSSIYGNSVLDKTVRIIKGNLIFANLAFVPVIMARQALSSPFYMMYSGGGNYMKAVGDFMKHPLKMIEWVKEVAPAVIASGTGFEITKTKPSVYSGPKLTIGNEDIYAREVKKALNDFGMKGIQVVDQIAKAIGFMAVYNKFEPEIGHDLAVREALYVTDLTQPTNDKTALPDIYRQSTVTDALLMYTQQPMKIINMLTSEMGQKMVEGKSDPRAYIEMFLGITAITLSTLGIWVMKNRRLPEDAKELLGVFAQGYINNIPLAGKEIIGGLTGYTSATQFYAPLKAIGVLASDRDFEKKVEAVIDGLAAGTGVIPTNVMNKTMSAIENEDIMDLLIGVKSK